MKRNFYVAGAIFVGLLQVIEGGGLLLSEGNFGGFSHLLALFEFAWCIFSVVVIWRVAVRPVKFLALAFVLYNVFGWLVGGYLASSGVAPHSPIWFSVTEVVFGASYATAALFYMRRV